MDVTGIPRHARHLTPSEHDQLTVNQIVFLLESAWLQPQPVEARHNVLVVEAAGRTYKLFLDKASLPERVISPPMPGRKAQDRVRLPAATLPQVRGRDAAYARGVGRRHPANPPGTSIMRSTPSTIRSCSSGYRTWPTARSRGGCDEVGPRGSAGAPADAALSAVRMAGRTAHVQGRSQSGERAGQRPQQEGHICSRSRQRRFLGFGERPPADHPLLLAGDRFAAYAGPDDRYQHEPDSASWKPSASPRIPFWSRFCGRRRTRCSSCSSICRRFCARN